MRLKWICENYDMFMSCECERGERMVMVHIHHDVFDGDEKPKSCVMLVGRPKERMNAKAKSN